MFQLFFSALSIRLFIKYLRLKQDDILAFSNEREPE